MPLKATSRSHPPLSLPLASRETIDSPPPLSVARLLSSLRVGKLGVFFCTFLLYWKWHFVQISQLQMMHYCNGSGRLLPAMLSPSGCGSRPLSFSLALSIWEVRLPHPSLYSELRHVVFFCLSLTFLNFTNLLLFHAAVTPCCEVVSLVTRLSPGKMRGLHTRGHVL